MSKSAGREVALIGAVNLDSAEEVFRLAAETLGERVRRVSDGETGPARSQWLQCQRPFFLQHPLLEIVESDPERPGGVRQPRVPAHGIYARTWSEMYRGRARLRDGVDPSDLVFDGVGYADWAIESYAALRRLKEAGEAPETWRFQVSLPAPRLVLMAGMVLPEHLALIAPAYEAAFREDIARMSREIPAAELAIQWDCTHPLQYERAEDDAGRQAVVDELARLASFVPEGVELGYHLCYGDFEHRHEWEPRDLGTCVALANGIVTGAGRSIDWIHMPVPREREDAAFFAPLNGLSVPSATSLVLGLVHHTDGVGGTRARIAAALDVRPEFAISCECGMGRRPRETMRELFEIHADAADSGAPVR
jgi:hypothetical protein